MWGLLMSRYESFTQKVVEFPIHIQSTAGCNRPTYIQGQTLFSQEFLARVTMGLKER